MRSCLRTARNYKVEKSELCYQDAGLSGASVHTVPKIRMVGVIAFAGDG